MSHAFDLSASHETLTRPWKYNENLMEFFVEIESKAYERRKEEERVRDTTTGAPTAPCL